MSQNAVTAKHGKKCNDLENCKKTKFLQTKIGP